MCFGMHLLVSSGLSVILMPSSTRREQNIKQQWVSKYMVDSNLFHILCFSHLARPSATNHASSTIYQRAYWYCYSEVIREVNRRFSDPSTRYSDENLFAVMTLAFHGSATEVETCTPRSPSQGPLTSMQLLDIYTGRLDPVDIHLRALNTMLTFRGGLGDIKFPGLAAMLS
jgi:hypothetical protein